MAVVILKLEDMPWKRGFLSSGFIMGNSPAVFQPVHSKNFVVHSLVQTTPEERGIDVPGRWAQHRFFTQMAQMWLTYV